MRTKLRNGQRRLGILDGGALPRPLQRSAPREVAFSASGWVAMAWAVALLLVGVVGGLLLALQLGEDSARATELQASGIPTEALVTQVSSSREKKPRVTIHYRYSANGQEFSNRTQLRRNDPFARTAKVGSQIRVLYLPSGPARSWPDGYAPRERPVWVAAILPIVVVPCALLIVRMLRRQKRLLEEGRAVMARIISAEKTSTYQDFWRVTYSWTLLSGAVRKAHVMRTAEPAAAGAFVPVLYHPDQPEHHSVYPLSLFKLR